MSASVAEVREVVDALLHMLQVRIKSGKLIVHIDDFRATRVSHEVNHRPIRGEIEVDKPITTSAG